MQTPRCPACRDGELEVTGSNGETFTCLACKKETCRVAWLEDEVEAWKHYLSEFIGFVATCRRENTYDWMRLMLDHLNGAAIALDSESCFELRGASDFVMRPKPDLAPSEQPNATPSIPQPPAQASDKL